MIAAGEQVSVQESLGFEADAVDVLGGLRAALTAVLTSFSGLRKPADLQKLFKLDWTLSWQVFQIAGPAQNDAAILGIGSKIPARASLKRFIDAAEARGVDATKIDRVWSAFDRFEHLVETHAGDRSSFISMVSAASGFDAEWLATDAQHRRNTFRATSHLVGMQAMAKHICGIIDEAPDGQSWNIGVVVGYVGLRMLRAMPSALVFRMRMTKPAVRSVIKRVPLGSDPDKAGGYLLPEFSTDTMPSLVTRELDAGWLVTELENPRVGNQGACSLRFGTGYLGHPIPGVGEAADDASFASDVVVDKPVEVIISDLLVRPGIMRGTTPTAEVWLGAQTGDSTPLPGDLINVPGDHRVECLGRGPDALVTPDIPNYTDMVNAAARTLGTDISTFDAWRLRLDYPMFQSTVRMNWELPRTTR